jgi:hypothetical protein
VKKDEDTIYIAGGINKNLSKINSNFFVFRPKNHSIEKLPDMNQIRYTFPLVYHDNRVYAIGGRIYGSDDVSLLANCEYYDIEKRKWFTMPDMKRKRCTALAFVSGKFSTFRKSPRIGLGSFS